MNASVFGERFVAPFAVDRDAQHLRLEFRELFEHFVVEGNLVAADRAPVGGIKDEHYRLAPEIRERVGLAGDRFKREWRRGSAGC